MSRWGPSLPSVLDRSRVEEADPVPLERRWTLRDLAAAEDSSQSVDCL